MILNINFTLPLTNPVIVFSLVLFIILFAPILLNKIKVPHIIGLIVAGVIIGPHGFNLLLRDSSIVLFGTVGLLYIMFTAGLEIDIEQFKRNTIKSFVFGLYTFIVPLISGTLLAYYVFHFTFPASLLLGGMFSSHTLLAYPIVRTYQITRILPTTLTIGGTIVADLLALLVLATVTGMTRGEIGSMFWIRLTIATLLFGAVILFGYPLLARRFFKRYEDPVSQYIFVLAMVFLGAFLAELVGLEGIIGAFISGLALNRFIPHSSALMNRIEFVGNAIFIPFFLISVGMLVDFTVLFSNINSVVIALLMTVVAIGSKFVAALITQGTFKLSRADRQLIFGLSTARVGATLAIVLVGYNTIVGETISGDPIRLISEEVLNGTVIMILCTCTVSSFVVEKASQVLALQQPASEASDTREQILVSLAYPETVVDLIDFGLMLRQSNVSSELYALNVVTENKSTGITTDVAKKMMDKAAQHASSHGQSIIPILRHDANVSNGIIYTLKEKNITDLVIGLHHKSSADNFLGPVAEEILRHTSETVFIYRPVQPLNTLKRIIAAVTQRAQLEPGFGHWMQKIVHIAKEAGAGIEFFGDRDTRPAIEEELKSLNFQGKSVIQAFDNWDDFLIFSREVKKDDLFIVVSSRKGQVSYNPSLSKLPYFMSRYFMDNSFIMLYPQQLESDAQVQNVQYVDSSIARKIASVGKRGSLVKRLFGAARRKS